MLTDTKLKNLKPAEKAYKVPDRDGMYATVLPSGTISFRYNYRLNGRYETLVLGRYGAGGLSLQEARERLQDAKKAQSEGKSPSRLKAQSRNQLADGEPFSVWAERWLLKYKMAESTRDMRRAVYERDLKRPFGSLLLHEITHNELRSVCDAILARGAPATAVHARDIVKLVFKYAEQRGKKVENPADLVAPSSIAVFEPRDRALGAEEIALFYEHIEYVQCAPTLRLACKLLLLTMVRKSELTDATWSEGARGQLQSYLTRLQTAESMLRPYMGTLITVRGVVMTGDGAPQSYIGATPSQRSDPYLNDVLGMQPPGSVMPGVETRDQNRLDYFVALNGSA
ncbi:putative prophage CPS-53 integrase [Janthinobacterium sp. HH106]|nr:integrase arm-type DNA-binding domain-containing protein [Janthinobacterium sp. HH106]OEZ93131.1 putative prophage CPS-53 integrase [Janthinobacterium sp. HH106]